MQTTSNGKRNAVDIAKIVDRKASEYQKVLNQTSGHLSSDNQEKIIEARDAAQAASFAAVTALIEQQQTGRFSADEVRQRVNEKLSELEGEIQLVALRLNLLTGKEYPEVTSVGGPTVPALIADLGRARQSLETAKNFFAQGGLEAALNHYREGVGYLNQLQWGIGLYDQAQEAREQAAEQPAAEPLNTDDEKNEDPVLTNEQQP